MVLAVGTVTIVVLVVVCLALLVVVGGAGGTRWQKTMEDHGPLGDRRPEPPGFRKPPNDGGLL